MNVRTSLPRLPLFFSLILCVAAAHADTGRRLKLSWDAGTVETDRSRAGGRFSVNEQSGWRGASGGSRLEQTGLIILGGVVGNMIGLCAGVNLANFDSGAGQFADPIVGGLVGSVCGSALGVYIAGTAIGRRGNFGSALLGSLLGEVAAVALVFAVPSEEFPFLAGFFVLPPIGAAIVFNNSFRSRSSRSWSGILNLAGGKLELGVPDIRIRPVFVPGGGKAKPEMQFNVNVLSVEL